MLMSTHPWMSAIESTTVQTTSDTGPALCWPYSCFRSLPTHASAAKLGPAASPVQHAAPWGRLAHQGMHHNVDYGGIHALMKRMQSQPPCTHPAPFLSRSLPPPPSPSLNHTPRTPPSTPLPPFPPLPPVAAAGPGSPPAPCCSPHLPGRLTPSEPRLLAARSPGAALQRKAASHWAP